MIDHNFKEKDYIAAGVHRKGPWTNDSQLGQRLGFAKVETVNTGPGQSMQFSTPLDETAAFNLSPFGEPRVWTVSLAPDYNIVPAQDINFALTAIIKFGAGGTMQTVEIDVENGASISAPMSAVEIRVDQNRESIFPRAEIPWDYTIPDGLGVQYTIGQGTSLSRLPRRTKPYLVNGSDPITDLDVIPIPPFASHVIPYSIDLNNTFDVYAAVNNLLFFASPNDASVQPPMANISAAAALGLESGIIIPQGCRGIAYQNNEDGTTGPIKFRFLISI